MKNWATKVGEQVFDCLRTVVAKNNFCTMHGRKKAFHFVRFNSLLVILWEKNNHTVCSLSRKFKKRKKVVNECQNNGVIISVNQQLILEKTDCFAALCKMLGCRSLSVWKPDFQVWLIDDWDGKINFLLSYWIILGFNYLSGITKLV